MRRYLLLLFVLPFWGFACSESRHTEQLPKNPPRETSAPAPTTPAPPMEHQTPEVLRTLPHDHTCYTQGLEIHDGIMYETGGLVGRSTLRKIDMTSWKVLQKVNLPMEVFGEGLTVLNGKIYVLTWRDQRCLIYDQKSLQLLGETPYLGEGWGLTNDGESLIMTNGSHIVSFVSPDDFRVKRTVEVYDVNRPLDDLNEVEFFNGEIWANVYQTDNIVRIDPQTGAIKGWIDMRGLLPRSDAESGAEVLNGIAFDHVSKGIYVTGKYWPKLFEIHVKN